MIINPDAVSLAIFVLPFKVVSVVEPLEAEAVLFVLAVHGDLELLLIIELSEVASLAIHPVSLENTSIRQNLFSITMKFSIEETSGVLSFCQESLVCPMSLYYIILEDSFICIAIRESLLAQPMS
jgi:hypothetical protein